MHKMTAKKKPYGNCIFSFVSFHWMRCAAVERLSSRTHANQQHQWREPAWAVYFRPVYHLDSQQCMNLQICVLCLSVENLWSRRSGTHSPKQTVWAKNILYKHKNVHNINMLCFIISCIQLSTVILSWTLDFLFRRHSRCFRLFTTKTSKSVPKNENII